MSDSTPLDSRRLQHLRTIAAVVEDLRAAVARTERVRDDLIRELKAEGVSAPDLVDAARLGRARVYGIISEPVGYDVDEDPEEFVAWQEQLDQVAEYALDRWLENDEQGHPDDYIPLEALFERR